MHGNDWAELGIASTLILVAAAGGGWAGFQGGKDGLGLLRAVLASIGRGALLILAATPLLAGTIALHELRKEAATFLHHNPADPGCWCLKCQQELLISSPTPPLRVRLRDPLITDPGSVYLDNASHGLVWAFVVPALCLAGSIPAGIAGFIAYTFGSRARIRGEWIGHQRDF